MKIIEATYSLLDTETTRKDPAEPENELIEVACDLYKGDGSRLDSFSSLVYVTRPIPPENSAIHHLTMRDILEAPEREKVIQDLRNFIPEGAVPVAHNAKFDAAVLHDLDLGEWLCTERMAHHLAPHAPNWKLQTLRYLCGIIDIDYSGLPEERRVHSAAGDLRVLAPVFFHLLEKYRDWATDECNGDLLRFEKAEQIETLLAWAKRPYVMTKWPPFGKHAGIDCSLIPLDYFDWCLSPRGLTDMDDDLRWNIQREIKRRTERRGAA